MFWLTWRQFRTQAIGVGVFVAVLAAWLVYLGIDIRDTWDASLACAGCSVDTARETVDRTFELSVMLSGFTVVIVPLLLGAFWGAPLIAREIEGGTHRLVWNQSVTRRRWLAVKLGVVTVTAAVLAGGLSWLMTWAASPYDAVLDKRFEVTYFPTRNIVPIGYAVFAVALGALLGLVAKRTIPAMAMAMAAFAAMQIVMPALVRPHLQPAVTETIAYDESTMDLGGGIGVDGEGKTDIHGYFFPGSWALSTSSPLLTADGTPVSQDVVMACFGMERGADFECLADQNLHFEATYQPGDRYWTFQWIETGVYVLLGGLFAAYAFRRIPRGLG